MAIDTSDDRAKRSAGWRLMRSAVRPYRLLMYLGIAAGVVWTVARVAIPALTGIAIDRGVTPKDWSAARTWMLLILLVGIVQSVSTGLRRYIAFKLALRVETDLRMKLVAHLQHLHFAFHDHAQTGQLMAYANTDIQQIQNVILLIPLTIASTLTMIAVIVILVLRSPGLALFALAALPVLQLRGDPFHPSHVPGRARTARRAVRPVRRRRGERHRSPRRQGLRRRASPAPPARHRGRQRLRPLDRHGEVARQLPAAHRSASDPRARRHPLVRRPPGARRATSRSATSSPRTSTC